MVSIEEGKKRRALFTGDTNILRRFSYSLSPEKSFVEIHVWPAFLRSFNNVVEAKVETNKLISKKYNSTNVILAQVPASRIHEITGENTVDYCFTDPPYSNEIYFLDLFTLWAAWLDLKIAPEVRNSELLVDNKRGKTREQFLDEFGASMESIARALKPDRWFTLVYKHRDISLWESIVAACEKSGFQYINAVWQDITFRSTRQIENPNINPSGDMYLNFRKMSRDRFEKIYGTDVRPLPTQPKYVEFEVERLIVSYLGADIKLIVSGVIQQILDSRAFRNYHEDPKELSQDIQEILKSSKFIIWKPEREGSLWLISPDTTLDPSLPLNDRIRYYVFDFLRRKNEATEGEIRQYILKRLADAPMGDLEANDLSGLLRQVGQEIGHHRWRFDEEHVVGYKQLRLIFPPSQADEIRKRIEAKVPKTEELPLTPYLEGIALLRDRLVAANLGNKQFDIQYDQLLEVIKTVIDRLKSYFSDQVEEVWAVGDWAELGIDLRNLPFEEVLVQIVLRSNERPFSLYWQIAQKVFADLHDETIRVQFKLATLPDWQRAKEVAQVRGKSYQLGIPLLVRTK